MITVSTPSSSSQLEPISTPLIPANTTISVMPAASMKMPSIKPTDSSLVLPAKFVLIRMTGVIIDVNNIPLSLKNSFLFLFINANTVLINAHLLAFSL